MKMTLLALPNPGPPAVACAAADAFCKANIWPRLTPRMPEPPTQRRSRRVRPSQVSRETAPGTTSIAGLQREAGGRQRAGCGRSLVYPGHRPPATNKSDFEMRNSNDEFRARFVIRDSSFIFQP